jgi:serine protease AprX
MRNFHQLVICSGLLLAANECAANAIINANLLSAAQRAPMEVIIELSSHANTKNLSASKSGDAKLAAVVTDLRADAEQTQSATRTWLTQQKISFQSFWVANFIIAKVNAEQLTQLAAREEIIRIEKSGPLGGLQPGIQNEPIRAPTGVEASLTLIKVPDVWALGVKGAGVVVAGQDTGYAWQHSALKRQYRGWNGDTADPTVNHNYNWYDAIRSPGSGGAACGPATNAPCDDNSHGSHTMGTMIGDDGGANQIGIAPDAKWIGCRNMDQGNGTPATYATCFQWLLAPTDLNGLNPDPSKAPDVINNSWGCPTSEGCTAPDVLRQIVENVSAAGILVVVSAGNSGSGCSSVTDPAAIYEASFTVGNSTNTDVMASSSSRGPVTFDGSNRLKPEITAPGTSIRSSIPPDSYGVKTGTSMSGPHIVGVAALVMSANPALRRNPAAVKAILRASVEPIASTQTCGAITPPVVPNNVYGYGRINALKAVQAAQAISFTNGFEKQRLQISL